MDGDPYEVLGVPRDAEPDAIKRAYRRLALRYHPDRNPGDLESEERFKRITRAYEILGDPVKRRTFDQTGRTDGMPDMSDMFGGFGMDDAMRAFRDFFGFGSPPGEEERGADARVQLDLELSEVALGGSREMEIERDERCPVCDGSGAHPDVGTDECRDCDGTGRITRYRRTMLGTMRSVTTCPSCAGRGVRIRKACPECGGRRLVARKRKVRIEIPAGVTEGHYIRLRGMGHMPPGDGSPGDLIAGISSIDYGEFTREGDDLVYDVELSFPEAVLGTRVSVPTIEGEREDYELPKGVSHGERMVVRRRGIKHLQGMGRGDVVVRAGIHVPGKVPRRDRKLLEQLLEEGRLAPPGRDDGS